MMARKIKTPPPKTPKAITLGIRVTEDQRDRWHAAAYRAGEESFGLWARRVLEAAAKAQA